MRNRLGNMYRLAQIASFVSGSTPSKQESIFWGGMTPWVSAKDLKSLEISRSQITLSETGRLHATLVPTGTVLVLVRGMSLFRSIPIGIAGCELAINQDVKGLIPSERLSPEFLAYSLLAQESTLLQSVEAAGHGTGRLDTEVLKEIWVAVPSRTEQARVVETLNTWDTAIVKTQKLISAKSLALRGLMQLLFNHGISRYVRLSDCATRVTRRDQAGGGLPLTISGRDGLINQLQFYDKRIAADATEHYTLLKRGEFAYNRSYSSGYPYGAIKRLDSYDEGVVSSLCLCFALIPDGPILSDYFVSFCEAGGFNHQIHMIAQEGARNHGLLNVSTSDFFAMKMPVPSLKEQARVVNILATATKEIQLLREELDELRKQKRGLMQRLLRGYWRVGPGGNGARV